MNIILNYSFMDFTIDEYEKSTKEFEKYVNTIPKKVPLKLTKSNTIGSLVKEYYQKAEYTDTEELLMMNSILQSLKNWGKQEKKPIKSQNDAIISICNRHDDFAKRLENVNKEISSLSELIEFKITEANGFTSESEIENVISVLNSKIKKLGSRSKESEKIALQVQELNDLIPEVRTIQKMYEDIEILEGEKEVISENIEQTVKHYQELIAKCG